MTHTKYVILKIAVVILIPFFLSGCLDKLFTQRDATYQGKNLVEFKPTTNTVNARTSSSADPVIASPLLQLISSKGTLDTDISIEFTIADSSTAKAGNDYQIMTPSPLTIAAGKVFTTLKIQVTGDNLKKGQTKVLYISLKSISGAKAIPAFNYKTYTLIIRGN